MVKLIANPKDVPTGMKYIRSADWAFMKQLSARKMVLDPVCLEYLRSVDNAEYVDSRIGTVVTRFGITGIENISTGLKTLILAHWFATENTAIALNIGECGRNVLPLVFSEINNTDVIGLLSHTAFDREELYLMGCTIGGIVAENRLGVSSQIIAQREVPPWTD